MKKVISCEYVDREIERAMKCFESGLSRSAIKILNDIQNACKNVSDTSKGLDKGEVIKWK